MLICDELEIKKEMKFIISRLRNSYKTRKMNSKEMIKRFVRKYVLYGYNREERRELQIKNESKCK